MRRVSHSVVSPACYADVGIFGLGLETHQIFDHDEQAAIVK